MSTFAQVYCSCLCGTNRSTNRSFFPTFSAKQGMFNLLFASPSQIDRFHGIQLLQQGRSVVAATRDVQKGKEVLAALEEQYGASTLTIEGGIDITDKSSIEKQKLWQGISQVAIAVGPVFGRQPGGEMGYAPAGNLRTYNMPRMWIDNELTATSYKTLRIE